MPRETVNVGISNLSVTLPRRIHRLARVRAIRSGAPTLAAYVAVVLSRAGEQLTAAEQVEAQLVELELAAMRTRSTGQTG